MSSPLLAGAPSPAATETERGDMKAPGHGTVQVTQTGGPWRDQGRTHKYKEKAYSNEIKIMESSEMVANAYRK